MKTSTNKRIDLLKLTRALIVIVLAGLGLNANAQCVADFSFSVNPANDGVVTFTNNSTGSFTPLYQWNFGDGGYVSGTSATHTYATGTYNACLIMTDSSGTCTDSVCHSITVTNTSSGVCNASFYTVDSAGITYFVDQSTGISLNYSWTFGDAQNGTGTGGTAHTYPGAGLYYACLTVSNFSGCSSTFCDTVIVGTPGTSGACLGVVDATFNASDSTSGLVVFFNSATGPGQVYHWDFGDGGTSNVAGNTSHQYASNGTYPVCLTVYDTASTDSCQYCTYVNITSVLSCNASFYIVQDTLDSYNYNVYNSAPSTSGTANYYWDFGDGATSTLQYPTHTYAGTGPYYLCLTILDTNALGTCSDTFCDSLAAGRSSTGITVTVVAPVSTGIAEQATTTLLENYPNPFSGSTTINYTIAADAAVELNVVDLLGNKTAMLENSHKAAGSYSVSWNADGVAQGMYLLQMKVNNSVTIKKIIVNK